MSRFYNFYIQLTLFFYVDYPIKLMHTGNVTLCASRLLIRMSIIMSINCLRNKQAFTIIDQNRDGIISKDDLRDVLASMGQLNVKNEELEAMIKEASGPINFTVFLTMFGEKLKGKLYYLHFYLKLIFLIPHLIFL